MRSMSKFYYLVCGNFLSLYYFPLITFFTIHNFRAVGGEIGFDRFAAMGTGAVEEFERAAAGEAFGVAALETFPRNRNKRFFVYLEFRFDDFVISAARNTRQDFIHNRIRHVFDMIWQINRLFGGGIMPRLGIFPSKTRLCRCFFSKREPLLSQ